METLDEMKKRHASEFKQLQANCPHNKVEILDTPGHGGAGRNIVLRCILCGTPVVGWEGGKDRGQVLYAKGFVKE